MARVAVDFYNGAAVLQELSEGAHVEGDQGAILNHIVSFAEAYETLVGLHERGKLGAGDHDFSRENLERVKRIVELLRAGLDTGEARRELRDLSTRCLQGLLSASWP